MNEQALKDRLQIISKEKQIHFNECWKQLLLEQNGLRNPFSLEKGQASHFLSLSLFLPVKFADCFMFLDARGCC